MLKRILAFHAECCRFARKQQRRNLRFKSKVLDHLKPQFQPIESKGFAYSPNLTLKNWLCAPLGGVTSIVVITALFFPFTSTPLVIGEAEPSPCGVSDA